MTIDGMALANLAKVDTLGDRVATEILTALARRRQSQAALARAMGVPAMWVSDRLTGKTQLTLNDLERIAETLEVSAADLVPTSPRDRYIPVSHSPLGVTRKPAVRRPSTGPRAGRPVGHPGGSRRPDARIRTSPFAEHVN